MKHYESLIQQCDAEIRQGRPQVVARLLVKINPAHVPREWRLPLAKISRRSGLYSFGLKLLSPLVLTLQANVPAKNTPPELAEYAVLLLRSGLVDQAAEKLASVDSREVPDALLYRAFADFTRWNFSAAIPDLKRYIEIAQTPYAALIGNTNLAYALVETRQLDAAFRLLDDNIRQASRDGHKQLESNSRAMMAQAHLLQGRYASARQEIRNAIHLFGDTKTNDQFFALKWNLILDGLEAQNEKPFEELRTLAAKNGSWETCRDADLFSLKVKSVRERFLHLYFGTPYAGFRDRIFAELGQRPAQLIYVLGRKDAPRLDLRNGEIDGQKTSQSGGKCHQLLDVLLRDFYSPLRVGGLFAGLFPQEQFNISSSPDRVHQLIRRTRRWLKDERIPVEIHEEDGCYSLRIVGRFSFRVPLERQAVDSNEIRFEKIKAVYGGSRTFCSKQVANDLGLSAATVHRLLHWAIELGRIKRADYINGATYFTLASDHSTESQKAA